MTNPTDHASDLIDIAADAREDLNAVPKCSCGTELVEINEDLDYCPVCDCDEEDDAPEHDGQPTEYEEWQDFYGGDDWDQGQYDEGF